MPNKNQKKKKKNEKLINCQKTAKKQSQLCNTTTSKVSNPYPIRKTFQLEQENCCGTAKRLRLEQQKTENCKTESCKTEKLLDAQFNQKMRQNSCELRRTRSQEVRICSALIKESFSIATKRKECQKKCFLIRLIGQARRANCEKTQSQLSPLLLLTSG